MLRSNGLKSTAVDVMPEGLDDEVGHRPCATAVPDRKALDDVLIVYGMNGEPLPPDHGFPARLLVPGWIGISNIKWVGRIEVSEQPLFSAWNTTQYRLLGELYPEQPVLSTQVVKSAFELPFPATAPVRPDAHAARSFVVGEQADRAGRRAGDRSGSDERLAAGSPPWPQPPARVGALDAGLAAAPEPGGYELLARATDRGGMAQPDTVPFNAGGYQFWAVVRRPRHRRGLREKRAERHPCPSPMSWLATTPRATPKTFDRGDLPLPRPRRSQIVACMDARLLPARVLGFEEGDVRVIRNAGGVVTDDEIRSLAISQRLLGTEEIILIHHTDCGMLTFTDDEFKRSIQEETGIEPDWAAESFPDLDEDVHSRSPVSRPARSSRARSRFGASSTTSGPARCARCRGDAADGRSPRARERVR